MKSLNYRVTGNEQLTTFLFLRVRAFRQDLGTRKWELFFYERFCTFLYSKSKPKIDLTVSSLGRS